MFERFTEGARQVVVLAQDESRALRHGFIGTEHILLGLLREEEGLAARVLESLGLKVEEARSEVARIVGQGAEVKSGQIPFTPRAKKALELSLREALSLGHNYIGTEHILLGLVRVDEGVATRILLDFGTDAEKIRDEVVRVLSGRPRAWTEKEEIPFHVRREFERLQAEKEGAMEGQDFDRAAGIRERQRALLAIPAPGPLRRIRTMPRRLRQPGFAFPTFVVAALGFPLGLLAGWLIWG